ncbi:FeoA family protein [Mycoplasma sp. SG1]|uniref:FeoA family protein n=1 Tax=Mycoplasma sp. SG1 TaxID=2810348 RepID=UPI0020249F65|nr:FeoA family protein [Mycoplasma sp. SG1]URM52806.1 ferrous iron transport protein A [Mycoplasma sp. SG1]
MHLLQMKLGESGVIKKINTKDKDKLELFKLGVWENSKIKYVYHSPAKFSRAFLINDSNLVVFSRDFCPFIELM